MFHSSFHFQHPEKFLSPSKNSVCACGMKEGNERMKSTRGIFYGRSQALLVNKYNVCLLFKPIRLNFAHPVVDLGFRCLTHSEGKQTKTLEFGEEKGLLQGPSKENGRLLFKKLKLLNSCREGFLKNDFIGYVVLAMLGLRCCEGVL